MLEPTNSLSKTCLHDQKVKKKTSESQRRPAVELGAVLGQEAVVVDVHQISSLALRRARLGLEEHLDLHPLVVRLGLGLLGSVPEGPGRGLGAEDQAQDANLQLPHLTAALHSWQLPREVGGGGEAGGGGGEESCWRSEGCAAQRKDCQVCFLANLPDGLN